MREKIKLIGVTLLLVAFIMFAELFITAYRNPDKIVEVDINSFYEANLEFILLLITAFFGAMAFFFSIQDLMKNEKRKRAKI